MLVFLDRFGVPYFDGCGVLMLVIVNRFSLRCFSFFDGCCRFDACLCQQILSSLSFVLFNG
jgi:hypothetical protein